MIINLRNWKNDIGHTAYSGTCGSTAYWSLSDTGYLVIYGTGAMTDYTSSTTAPWYSYLSQIKAIIILGITHIGNYAFVSCSNAKLVSIPNSITSIGNNCFYSCTALTSITIPDSVTTIGNNCFYSCTALTSIIIGNSVVSIGEGCFSLCTAVTSIAFRGNQPTLASNSFFLGNFQVLVTATVYSSGWANATVFTSTIIGSYTTLSYVTV